MSYDKDKIAELLADASISYIKDASLRPHSTWRIGGLADFITFPESVDDIRVLLGLASKYNVPYLVVGKGSNLLFADEGLRGILIKLDSQFSDHFVDGNSITAQSGIFIPALARLACSNGLAGLAHVSGIPGNLGGLIAMNGGSMGSSISDSIQLVKTINTLGELVIFPRSSCCFGYRSSIFQKTDYIIVECKLVLPAGDPKDIFTDMLEILRSRRSKYPRRMPTCGSVFKSPSEIYGKFGPPGKIIEDLGFKGLRIGDAQISPEHANFFVNHGRAKANDMIALVEKVQTTFYDKYKCIMPCEFKYIDEYGKVSSLY